MRHAPLLALSLALACGATNTFDEGTICLADADAPATFQAGDDLELRVILDDCMSCPKDFHADCASSRDGDTINLSAGGSWKRDNVGACPAVCLELSATCVLRDLEPGTYTIVSGSNKLTVTLPSTDPVAQDEACN